MRLDSRPFFLVFLFLHVSCRDTVNMKMEDHQTCHCKDCVDLSTDFNHCGACDHRCDTRHSNSECRAGECVIIQCALDYADADEDAVNGCECRLQAETCDGVDNDCDGEVDEQVGEPCYDGPEDTLNIGVCHAGVRSCENGSWVACEAQTTPSEEICDGLDNDCDGETDERFTLDEVCTVGSGACARDGEMVCSASGLDSICSVEPGEPTPSDSTLDGLDDDCDGLVDEDYTMEPILLDSSDCDLATGPRAMVIAPDGTVHAVWSRQNGCTNSIDQLVHGWQSEGEAWQIEVIYELHYSKKPNHSVGLRGLHDTSMLITPDGRLHVVFCYRHEPLYHPGWPSTPPMHCGYGAKPTNGPWELVMNAFDDHPVQVEQGNVETVHLLHANIWYDVINSRIVNVSEDYAWWAEHYNVVYSTLDLPGTAWQPTRALYTAGYRRGRIDDRFIDGVGFAASDAGVALACWYNRATGRIEGVGYEHGQFGPSDPPELSMEAGFDLDPSDSPPGADSPVGAFGSGVWVGEDTPRCFFAISDGRQPDRSKVVEARRDGGLWSIHDYPLLDGWHVELVAASAEAGPMLYFVGGDRSTDERKLWRFTPDNGLLVPFYTPPAGTVSWDPVLPRVDASMLIWHERDTQSNVHRLYFGRL